MPEIKATALPLDYDSAPERFRRNVQAVERYGLAGDVHESVVDRLLAGGIGPVLDLGCGEGRFLNPARAQGLRVLALDYSATMLKAVPGPRTQGDACALPFSDHTFGAVVALYMLYHLANPGVAVAESYRLLNAGGLFIAAAPSRYNDPELAAVLPAPVSTFDAENGLEIINGHFQAVDVERWDAPLVYLPDTEALIFYLQGRQVTEQDVRQAVRHLQTPLTLTKRGALFIGRKQTSRD